MFWFIVLEYFPVFLTHFCNFVHYNQTSYNKYSEKAWILADTHHLSTVMITKD